jgi:hypothetical protein
LRLPPGGEYEQVWDGRQFTAFQAPLQCVHGEHQVQCLRGEAAEAGRYRLDIAFAESADAECPSPDDAYCIDYWGATPDEQLGLDFDFPDQTQIEIVIE